MSGFVFVSDADLLSGTDVLRLRVPAGIEEKSTLLEWFRVNLRLPSYFGANWDALEECLRDLSWIQEKKIVISHEDVPLRHDTRQKRTYLDILRDVARAWSNDPAHELVIAFDPMCREAVE